MYRFIKYELDYESETFIPVIFDVAESFQSIHNNFSSGITTREEYEL